MDNQRQLFMNIYDIKPTETFWEEVDDRNLYTEDARVWTKKEILDSIRRDGLKYQLNVDPQGNIKNGNVRYWACRYLLEIEQDERFRYLPVQRNYAAAQFHKFIDLTNTKGLAQEQVDQLVSVRGVDAALIGPSDLSLSLGVPGETNHPVMLESIQKVMKACRKCKIASGIHVRDMKTLLSWKDKGMTMLTYSTDAALLMSAAAGAVCELRGYT